LTEVRQGWAKCTECEEEFETSSLPTEDERREEKTKEKKPE
jgi:hypothetical protein